MQRRVLRIDGRPFMAQRDCGGIFEAHGALAALLVDEIRRMSPASMSVDRAFLRTMAATIHPTHH